MKVKQRPLVFILATLWVAPGLATVATAAPVDKIQSASATLSQAGADWYRAQARIAEELIAEHELALLHQAELNPQLEPCLNGNVSASGLFPSQEVEDIARSFADGKRADLLKDSPYLGAVNSGAAIR